jgi:hypothetical protein
MTTPWTPPMWLILEGSPFGVIRSYDYDQPWAMGRIEAFDAAAHHRMVELCALRAEVEEWAELPLVEDERRWGESLPARGLSAADAARYESGSWVIRLIDGQEREIHMPEFDPEGFVTWRW